MSDVINFTKFKTILLESNFQRFNFPFQVTILFRGPITEFISQKFAEFLQETIDDMNNRRFAATHNEAEIVQMLQSLLSLEGFKQQPLM